MHRVLIIILTGTLLSACGQHRAGHSQTQVQSEASKGLKDYYKDYFVMGVAISPAATKNDQAFLITKHFGSVTAENAMKMAPIHPEENRYNWAPADSIIEFATRHNLKVRGHTLCWHQQAPKWMFINSDGTPLSKEKLLQRLKDHITTVVTRYKGKIYAWDVVNEAISDNPNEYLRESEWQKICGDEYIRKAFEYAHAADPAAQLFYNDYNETNPAKRDKIFRLVKELKDAGVPIHGVGFQGHYDINQPIPELDSTLKKFTSLDLKIQITELDVSIYPKQHQASNLKASDFDTTYSGEREAQQTLAYKHMFETFRKYHIEIDAITFWNISDRHSWLDNFPVRRRKDYPLLFDRNLQPKKAFWAVVEFE